MIFKEDEINKIKKSHKIKIINTTANKSTNYDKMQLWFVIVKDKITKHIKDVIDVARDVYDYFIYAMI